MKYRIRIQPRPGSILPRSQATVVVYDPVNCMVCGDPAEATLTARCRMFRGHSKLIKDGPIDTTTGLPIQIEYIIPRYVIGRVCKHCQHTQPMSMPRCVQCGYGSCDCGAEKSTAPRDTREIEFLPESRWKRHKPARVTIGSIEAEDLASKIRLADERYWRRSRYDPRIRIFVKIQEPEEVIDVAAYRAFYRMNGNTGNRKTAYEDRSVSAKYRRVDE